MKKPLITLQDFTFTYSDQSVPILKEINVTIYEGEKILVIGPSGSGKSTFARCISGILPSKDHDDYTGTISYGDQIENKHISNFLPNELAINMEDSSEAVREKEKEISSGVSSASQPFQTYLQQKKLAGMKWFLSKSPSVQQSFNQLTDNQFEQMKTAGLFIEDKPLLIFDEPLANLDPKSGDATMAFIDTLEQETDSTVMIIEHRLEDALAYPIDRLILFSEGRIIADGNPSDVLKTDILSDIGIREPLYITAMRYAGVNLEHTHHLDNVHQVNGPNLKEDMERWLSYLPQFHYPPNEEVLLEVEDVSFKYPWNKQNIVDHISFKIMEGEILSLIGPNGSGKTTLVKLLSGQERIASGKLIWKGEEITDLNADKMKHLVGYVPQNPLETITQDNIDDELSFRLREQQYSEDEIYRRVEKVIEVCSLQYIRQLPMSALSFGQLRRVAIASVLALSPKMIIVDEPTAGQDFMRYTEILNFLQSIHLQGVTVLLVTHDIHLMLEYTKRALVVSEGKILADASPVYILASPEIIANSSLKETSLYTFSKHIGMNDPYVFTEKFIHYDRVARLF